MGVQRCHERLYNVLFDTGVKEYYMANQVLKLAFWSYDPKRYDDRCAFLIACWQYKKHIIERAIYTLKLSDFFGYRPRVPWHPSQRIGLM